MPIRDQKNLVKRKNKNPDLLSTVVRLSSFALSQTHPDQIIAQILKDIRKIFNAKPCWLFLIEDNKIILKRLEKGRSRQDLLKSQLLSKFSPQVLKRTYPMICNRIGELYKKNRTIYRFLKRRNIHKVMGVLLKKDGKLLGALNVARDCNSPDFTQQDLKSLSLLGNMIVMTEFKRTEEESKKSQDFLGAIIDNIPNPMFIKDRKHRWVVLNQALSDLVGYPRKKMLGKSDYDFFPKEQADFFWKKDEEMLRTGKVVDIPEEPVTDKEGNMHYLHTKKAPLKDSSGKITHLVGIIEDITKRKRTEAKLKESEEKYKTLVETSTDMIFMVDLNGNFLFTNRALERTLGYSNKEIKKINGFELVHPEDLKTVREQFAQLVEGKSVDNMEYRYKTKNGSYINILNNASPIFDPQGNTVAAFGVARDITKRKKTEEKLKLFSHSVDSSVDGIALGNLKDRITYVNEIFAKMFGYSREELIGKKIAFIYAKDQIPKLKRVLKATMEGGWRGELVGKRKDGELFPVAISASRVVDDEGKVIAHMASHTDITERKQTEDQLRKLSHAIEQSPSIVMITDTKGTIEYVNPKFVQITGYTTGEIIGTNAANLGKQPSEEQKQMWNTIVSGDEWRGEFHNKKKNGELYWEFASISSIKNRKGVITHFLKVAEDITDRKRAEEALRESEKRYKALFKSAAEGILVADIETKEFKYANPAICRMLGYTEEEFKRMSVVDIHPKDALERVISEFKAQARGEKTLAPNIPCLRKDRTTIYTDINTANVLIDGRECNVGLFTEITERKRAEKTLIRNERIATERARLLIALRNLDQIDHILTRVCEAIRDSGLFERAVMTLHKPGGRIVHIGQVGLPPDVVERARQAPPIDQNLRARITSKKFRISDSFFIPAEAGVDFSKTGRHVPQRRRKSVDGDWQPNDELFVPLRDFSGKLMGYLSVDTPTDGCRPDLETTQALEMLVEAAASRVREVEAQEILKRERDFSQSILETANSLIVCLDADAKITVFNQECERVTGYRGKEVLGKRWPDLFLPSDHHHFKLKSFTKWVRAHPRDRYEGPIVTKSGEIRTILWSNTAILGSGEKDVMAIAIGQDITERKRAEEVVRESEEKYRELVNTSVDGVISVDAQMKIILWNPGAERIFGYTEKEVMGQSLMKIVPERYRKAKKREFVEFRKTGLGPVIGETLELEGLSKDGTEVPVELSVSSRRIGESYITTSIVRDITERKQAEEALRRSEERYRTLVETAQEGIGIADLEENLLFVNQAFAELLGYKKEELLGKNLKDICDKAQYVMFRSETQKRKKGELSKYEAKLLTKRGKPKYVYISATPLSNERGNFIGTLAVLSDLTEIKKAWEYNVLLDASRSLSRTLKLEQVLKIGTEKMAKALKADRCSVALFDKKSDSAKIRHVFIKKGSPRPILPDKRTPPDEHFSQVKDALLREGYLKIKNVETTPIAASVKNYFRKAGIKSSLIIPLLVDKKLFGVFHNVSLKKLRSFTSEEISLAQTIANQVAVAVQNALLIEDLKKKHSQIQEQSKALERQYQEQTILMKISRELSKTLDLDRILQIATKDAAQALQIDRCAVALAFPEDGYAEIRSIYLKEGKPAARLLGYKLYGHQLPQAKEMFKKRKFISIPNIHRLSSKSFAKEYFLREGIKSALFVPMLHGKKLVGFFVLSTIKDFKTFTKEETKLAQTIADQVAVAIENAKLLELVRKSEENLKMLSAQLIDVQEDERKKIAQELHDEVGQMLQLMKMNLDRIKKDISSESQEFETTREWLLDTEKMLSKTIDDIRTLTFDLRPSMLDDFGLIPTLRWYIDDYSRRSNIKVYLKTKEKRYRFPPNIEVTLYRIIQEALTNVAKHAQATEASVLVSQKNSTAILSVRDNGVGFDTNKVLSASRGLGLLNIKERVSLLGGSFEIISYPKRGTRLNINIPFSEVKHEEDQTSGRRRS